MRERERERERERVTIQVHLLYMYIYYVSNMDYSGIITTLFITSSLKKYTSLILFCWKWFIHNTQIQELSNEKNVTSLC
jgi:hypothetical protein